MERTFIIPTRTDLEWHVRLPETPANAAHESVQSMEKLAESRPELREALAALGPDASCEAKLARTGCWLAAQDKMCVFGELFVGCPADARKRIVMALLETPTAETWPGKVRCILNMAQMQSDPYFVHTSIEESLKESLERCGAIADPDQLESRLLQLGKIKRDIRDRMTTVSNHHQVFSPGSELLDAFEYLAAASDANTSGNQYLLQELRARIRQTSGQPILHSLPPDLVQSFKNHLQAQTGGLREHLSEETTRTLLKQQIEAILPLEPNIFNSAYKEVLENQLQGYIRAQELGKEEFTERFISKAHELKNTLSQQAGYPADLLHLIEKDIAEYSRARISESPRSKLDPKALQYKDRLQYLHLAVLADSGDDVKLAKSLFTEHVNQRIIHEEYWFDPKVARDIETALGLRAFHEDVFDEKDKKILLAGRDAILARRHTLDAARLEWATKKEKVARGEMPAEELATELLQARHQFKPPYSDYAGHYRKLLESNFPWLKQLEVWLQELQSAWREETVDGTLQEIEESLRANADDIKPFSANQFMRLFVNDAVSNAKQRILDRKKLAAEQDVPMGRPQNDGITDINQALKLAEKLVDTRPQLKKELLEQVRLQLLGRASAAPDSSYMKLAHMGTWLLANDMNAFDTLFGKFSPYLLGEIIKDCLTLEGAASKTVSAPFILKLAQLSQAPLFVAWLVKDAWTRATSRAYRLESKGLLEFARFTSTLIDQMPDVSSTQRLRKDEFVWIQVLDCVEAFGEGDRATKSLLDAMQKCQPMPSMDLPKEAILYFHENLKQELKRALYSQPVSQVKSWLQDKLNAIASLRNPVAKSCGDILQAELGTFDGGILVLTATYPSLAHELAQLGENATEAQKLACTACWLMAHGKPQELQKLLDEYSRDTIKDSFKFLLETPGRTNWPGRIRFIGRLSILFQELHEFVSREIFKSCKRVAKSDNVDQLVHLGQIIAEMKKTKILPDQELALLDKSELTVLFQYMAKLGAEDPIAKCFTRALGQWEPDMHMIPKRVIDSFGLHLKLEVEGMMKAGKSEQEMARWLQDRADATSLMGNGALPKLCKKAIEDRIRALPKS